MRILKNIAYKSMRKTKYLAKLFVIKVDRILFKGKIISYIKLHVEAYKKAHAEEIYDAQSLKGRRYDNGKEIRLLCEREISVNDLILAQYHKGDYQVYKHVDGAVRLMAIEEYYGKNTVGFNLYNRMQAASGFDWTKRFKLLISSYEKEGYNGNLLEVDQNFAIMDGSHRLTLAYYHGIEFVKAQIYECDRNRSFDYDFFWKKGFSQEECKHILDKTEKILCDVNYEFIGVIWPPAMNLADDIISDLKCYMPDIIKVVKYKDYILEKGEFEHLFRALYYTDILNEAGMNTKIKQINDCLLEGTTEYPIRVFYLHINNPQIGVNLKNFTAQSQMIKRIKTVFRTRYKGKIENYQYDVIMHISDNYLQSKFCNTLFTIDYDLSDFFESIKNEPYAILRAKNSRQHSKFPQKWYIRSDSDILVRDRKVMKKLADMASDYVKRKFDCPWVEIKVEIEDSAIKIAAYMKGLLLYMFEFMQHIYGMSDEFADECMEHIQDGDYKYLPDNDEVIIRIVEYIHKPKKEWYLPYLRNNIDKLDEERLFKNLDTTKIQIQEVNKLINQLRGNVE